MRRDTDPAITSEDLAALNFIRRKRADRVSEGRPRGDEYERVNLWYRVFNGCAWEQREMCRPTDLVKAPNPAPFTGK